MSDDFEDVFDSLGNSKIKVHIEKRILDIIHKGNASDDLISRRPIRELIQNADDAFSDRIHIKFDKDGLTFQNDGLGLEVYNDADGIRRGTYDAISAINDENKEDDLFSSGTFGTGFRSAHLFSDQAQIHGKLDMFGAKGYYRGICSAYTDEIENIRSKDYNEAIRKGIIITKYRSNSDRPSRKRSLFGNPDGSSDFVTKLQDAEKRCGITFYWPWRKAARNKKWSAMTWNL
ncbi:hypothetical protein OAU60_01515, partial [Euryarchaeota archaeon]|nr:hypothetical protein [Euryarchaeota archaeon]